MHAIQGIPIIYFRWKSDFRKYCNPMVCKRITAKDHIGIITYVKHYTEKIIKPVPI